MEILDKPYNVAHPFERSKKAYLYLIKVFVLARYL